MDVEERLVTGVLPDGKAPHKFSFRIHQPSQTAPISLSLTDFDRVWNCKRELSEKNR